jgi:hypothetical protein
MRSVVRRSPAIDCLSAITRRRRRSDTAVCVSTTRRSTSEAILATRSVSARMPLTLAET